MKEREREGGKEERIKWEEKKDEWKERRLKKENGRVRRHKVEETVEDVRVWKRKEKERERKKCGKKEEGGKEKNK